MVVVRFLTLLLGVTFAAFLLVEVSPLDPVATYVARMQRGASPEQIAALNLHFGTELPWHQRYLNWLGDALTGDFGTSLITREPVAAMLAGGLANSFWLMALAWVSTGAGGYLFGVAAGAFRGSIVDRLIVGCGYVLTSTPTYIVGLVLLTIVAVRLGWAPVGLSQPLGVLSGDVHFVDRLRHMLLPAVTVALVGSAQLALHTREALSQLMDSDIARFARARGLSSRDIIVHHGLRHTLRPALVWHLASLSMLAGGSVVAETVFGYHGIGTMIIAAGLNSDVPLLLGAVTVVAAVVFVGNAAGDAAATRLNPRARTLRRMDG